MSITNGFPCQIICILYVAQNPVAMQTLRCSTSLLFIFISIATYARQNDKIQQATDVIQELLTTYPGVSVAVGVKDKVVWAQGFGYANVNQKQAVNTQHQFRYYSLSKSITGMALIKLIEAGKLDIEQSITHYLPNLPPHYAKVKVKYLINHTAGVRHYKINEWGQISNNHCNTTEEALPVFIDAPFQSEPGQVETYTSYGYVLLSRLVEAISQQSFEQYLQEALFSPLGIQSIHLDQSEALTNEVQYYQKWKPDKQKGKLAAEANNSCKFGGGGLVGNATDLAVLHLAMINQKITSPELTEQYYTGIPTTLGEPTDYAFGIGDQRFKSGDTYYIHTGAARGANAIVMVRKQGGANNHHVVVVILGNLSDRAMNPIVGKIAAIFN